MGNCTDNVTLVQKSRNTLEKVENTKNGTFFQRTRH